MNYIIQLYFKIEIEGEKKSQYDYQIRMIQAETEEEAFFVGKEIALKEESHFINENGNRVKWIFAGITDVKAFNPGLNGEVVHTSTIESEHKEDFGRYLKLKTKDLAFNLSKKELIFSL